MSRRLPAIVVFLFIIGLIAMPGAAQEATGPAQVGERWDAPTYGLHGPFWVGYRDFTANPDSDNPLRVMVWYPALNPEGLPEDTTYTAALKYPAWLPTDPVEWPGAALADAPPDMSGAPYPVVVFSHGYGNNPAGYAYFAEHLASQGFVVVAPDHHESEMGDGHSFVVSTFTRPLEVTQALDFAETLTAEGGDLAGLLDMDHVGIAGHSYGGYTALASGGAQIDYLPFLEECKTAAEGSSLAAMCNPAFDTFKDEVPAIVGLSEMPEELWPSLADPRIDAAVAMAGDAYVFTDEGMASLNLPLLAMGGTLDWATPFDVGAEMAYDHASSAEKALVALEGAYHALFMGNCPSEGSIFMDNGWQWACSEGIWARDRGHDLANHFATAFLRAELMGDEEARAALAPDAVAFDGVTYSAQGF